MEQKIYKHPGQGLMSITLKAGPIELAPPARVRCIRLDKLDVQPPW
jgi:hypothetical protein